MRAHLMMLGDRKFHGRIEDLVRRTGLAAHAAVANVVEEMLAIFGAMKDPILSERAGDLKDLAMQLGERLRQEQEPLDLGQRLAHVPQPVLAIRELLPSIVLQSLALGVRALVVERGTGFSHGAILARAFGMPAVRVAGLEALADNEGTRVLVDGQRGELLVDPDSRDKQDRLRAMVLPAEASRCHNPSVRLWVSIVDPLQPGGVRLARDRRCWAVPHRDDLHGAPGRLSRRGGTGSRLPATVRDLRAAAGDGPDGGPGRGQARLVPVGQPRG